MKHVVVKFSDGSTMSMPLEEWLAKENRQLRAVLEIQRSEKKAHHADRTAKSTEKKRENKRDHFSHEWLEAAHNAHPDYGAGRLAREARKIAALNGMDEAKRDKIKKYRAEQYLKTKCSK